MLFQIGAFLYLKKKGSLREKVWCRSCLYIWRKKTSFCERLWSTFSENNPQLSSTTIDWGIGDDSLLVFFVSFTQQTIIASLSLSLLSLYVYNHFYVFLWLSLCVCQSLFHTFILPLFSKTWRNFQPFSLSFSTKSEIFLRFAIQHMHFNYYTF